VVVALLAAACWMSPSLPGAVAAGPNIFAVDPFGNTVAEPGLAKVDASTGLAASSSVITIVAGPITGTVQAAQAIAKDPTSSSVYVVLQVAVVPNRVLATINLANGQATTIGNLGGKFSSITFATNGTLYGVRGDGDGTCPECLYTINKTTAAGTFVRTLGNGADGEVIVFDPNDGMLYHASGNGAAMFEKIDPANAFAVTPITTFNSEIFGMGFDPTDGTLILTDIGARIWRTTTAGVRTQLSTMEFDFRGVIVENAAVPTTTTITSSANPSEAAQAVIFTATVAPTVGTGVPTGTVQFSIDGNPAGSPVALTGGQASLTVSGLTVGSHTVVAAYSGGPGFAASTSPTLIQRVFDRIIRGSVPGNVIVPAGQSWAFLGASVGGNVTADRAAEVTMCGTTVAGNVVITRTTGFVFVGDVTPSDDAFLCAGNQLRGSVSLGNNAGGLELGGNRITGTATVTDNAGTPAGQDAAMEIEGNTIGGNLNCTGNTPPPTNDGKPNSVTGRRLSQCAVPANF